MDTNIKEKTITSVTVEASRFRDLIAGALTHAGKDETLARLHGVYLGREEGRVIAIATDRYRLIEGTIESEGEGESKPVRLAYGDAKAIASALAKVKREKATVTIAGDIVSVTVSGSTYTYTAHLDDLPPYKHLLPTEGMKPIDFPYVSFNPSFFADYGKIVGKKGQVIVRQYKADHAYEIVLNGDLNGVSWKALLMPMRVRD